MLSILIPSRNIPSWQFTQKTVDDIFNNATGEIEIIVVLDGYELIPPLREDKRLKIIHNQISQGMRPSIMAAANAAQGDFIMKADDHCAFGKGFDEILAADCDPNWLIVPSRYSLDAEKWGWKYGPIQYDYLCYPFLDDKQFGYGFHGKKWIGLHGYTECSCCRKGGYYHREKERENILIDDIIAFQGSCWFMSRDYFFQIGGMQQEGYLDHQEAQELCFKVWLSGGQCKVNKNTWYAHLHKDSRGYPMLRHRKIQSQIYSTKVWMGDEWEGQIKSFKSLVENPIWWPLELWPEDWDSLERRKDYDYSKWLE